MKYPLFEYLDRYPHRRSEWSNFAERNPSIAINTLAERFLKAELLQSRCSHFKVNP